MHASDLMTKTVHMCSHNDSVQRAMQLMWDHDCGVIPVIDSQDKVVGMVTDRDVAVAAYTQGKPLFQIPVFTAMAKEVHGVHENDDLETVEAVMRRTRVRRVPVLDSAGHLKGIISMNDLARHARRPGRKGDGLRAESIVQTLATVCEPPANLGSTRIEG